jgi:hypothetical protein
MRESRGVVLGLSGLLLSAVSIPVFLTPRPVSADRIIANITEMLEEDPENHLLIYNLARVHYMAFVNKSFQVPAWRNREFGFELPTSHDQEEWHRGMLLARSRMMALEELGWEPPVEGRTVERMRSQSDFEKSLNAEQRATYEKRSNQIKRRLQTEGWDPEALPEKDVLAHASKAMEYFERSLVLDPDNGLYHLGKASLGAEYLSITRSEEFDEKDLHLALGHITEAEVRDWYYLAFEHSMAEGIRGGEPNAWLGNRAWEAGIAFLNLTQKSDELSRGQEEKISRFHAAVSRRSDPESPFSMSFVVTPILVAPESGDTLEDLLAPGRTAMFDLDGDRVVEEWPWVQPDTGILVWDPLDDRNIVSGRQLFGSVSFFLFPSDGYEALRFLDNDQDGYLEGFELRDLALWRDRNGDGQSSRDEVSPLRELGVTAIRTRPDGTDDPLALQASVGLVYDDGRVVPTFDWVTSPSASPTHAGPDDR